MNEETNMTNVAKRTNRKPGESMVRKKTEWVAPPRVKEFLKWSKRDYDLEDYDLFERKVNEIVFKDNLLIHLDESTDKNSLGKILVAIIDFVQEKWNPDFVYDIVIKFT